ncbi:unnamed protein product [Didymodactylos carnosus]|uniref:Uncharacterized protein n=1 Tax=Didymodactylos carnosus TaxID=1234261 RepID=A0A8S2E3Z7_9BILA|nr:unnamed protein product [Didymodactylos carnosus]CAF3843584.1 unnamed protein product [Didymodactylos carnosus]
MYRGEVLPTRLGLRRSSYPSQRNMQQIKRSEIQIKRREMCCSKNPDLMSRYVVKKGNVHPNPENIEDQPHQIFSKDPTFRRYITCEKFVQSSLVKYAWSDCLVVEPIIEELEKPQAPQLTSKCCDPKTDSETVDEL